MSAAARRLTLRLLLTIGALVVVGLFLYRQRHLFSGFGRAISGARWYWVGVGFAAELASMIPLAEAQRVILRAAGTDTPLGEMVGVTFASNAIASTAPAGVAFAEGYAFRRYRHFGASEAVAAWAELASGAIAFAALAGMALAGAVIGIRRLPLALIPVLGVVFAGATGAAALFRRPHLMCDVIEWVEKHTGRAGGAVAPARGRLRSIAEELEDLQPSIRTWAAAYALSAANWFLDVVCLAFTFIAFAAPVPWAAILLAFAGTKVVSSIGVTPGGLGIAEGGMIAVFAVYHAKLATAVPAVVVYRAVTLFGLVGLGWILVPLLGAESRRRRHDNSRLR